MPPSSSGTLYGGIGIAWTIGLSIVGIAMVGLIIFAVYKTVQELNRKCIKREQVIKIGACDWRGTCGILTENYSSIADLPVIGEWVCVKQE